MAKNMDVPLLFDFYGDMLTEKQKSMIDLYYQQDLSLSEIAEIVGISRQGVRDSVKRAELQLFDMEARLGLVAKMKAVNVSLDAVARYANAIHGNAVAAGNKEIASDVDHLILLVEKLQNTIV